MNLTMYMHFSEMVRKLGWEAGVDIAGGHGCSSVEIIDNTESTTVRLLKNNEEAQNARKILESKGLNVACYSVFTNLYKAPHAIASLKEHAERAAAIGSPFLHHTVLSWFNMQEGLPDFHEAMECAVDAAEKVANHAEKFGITCLYEDQGFYANGIEGYRIFINEMKRRCKNVGVCGDTGNCLFVDVPAEKFFETFIDDIKHVHVKDYFRKNDTECPGKGWYKTLGGMWLADAPLGEGIVDIDACMEILKNAGYRGAIAIEATDIPHSVEYLRGYEFN